MKEPPIDAHVTCPRCHERQALLDPDGYTCASCGTSWVFATCGSCHERFHMDPAVGTWDCPSCGSRNGPTTTPALPMPERGSPSLGGRGPMLLAAAAVILAIVVVWAIFIRGPGPTAASSPSAPSPSTATPSTLEHLCNDVAPDMPLRVDSVTRTEAAVRADAKALKAEGNPQAAKAATDLADALASLASALGSQGDTLSANTAVQDALTALPC